MDIELFKNLDFKNLPGWEAQRAYAPPYRQAIMPKVYKAKKAAILFLLYKDNGDWFLPCILRNTYNGVHSNQIGFPGGKPEIIDQSLKDTAVRECNEEIDARPDQIEVLGGLTSLYIPPSNFEVHPFLGIYHDPIAFKPEDTEVKKIIPIRLKDHLPKKEIQLFNIQKKNEKVPVPGYQLSSGDIMWGASAMLFNELITFINNSLTLKINQG